MDQARVAVLCREHAVGSTASTTRTPEHSNRSVRNTSVVHVHRAFKGEEFRRFHVIPGWLEAIDRGIEELKRYVARLSGLQGMIEITEQLRSRSAELCWVGCDEQRLVHLLKAGAEHILLTRSKDIAVFQVR